MIHINRVVWRSHTAVNTILFDIQPIEWNNNKKKRATKWNRFILIDFRRSLTLLFFLKKWTYYWRSSKKAIIKTLSSLLMFFYCLLKRSWEFSISKFCYIMGTLFSLRFQWPNVSAQDCSDNKSLRILTHEKKIVVGRRKLFRTEVIINKNDCIMCLGGRCATLWLALCAEWELWNLKPGPSYRWWVFFSS